MSDALQLERARLTAAIRRVCEQIRAINEGVACEGSPRVRAAVAADFKRAAKLVDLVGETLNMTVEKVGALEAFELAMRRVYEAIGQDRDGPGKAG